jgi:hypothetical protein
VFSATRKSSSASVALAALEWEGAVPQGCQKRETVVECSWLPADWCPCVAEGVKRVSSNCWYQRRCGAAGDHLRWRRHETSTLSTQNLRSTCSCMFSNSFISLRLSASLAFSCATPTHTGPSASPCGWMHRGLRSTPTEQLIHRTMPETKELKTRYETNRESTTSIE